MNHRAIKLRELIDTDKRFNGSQKAFADRVGLTVGQVNQWLSGHRNMKDTTAREIENKIGYESGWFEITNGDQAEVDRPSRETSDDKLSPIEVRLVDICRQLNDDRKEDLLDTAELYLSKQKTGKDLSISKGRKTTGRQA